MNNIFENELAVYNILLQGLPENEGKFAVIKGQQLLGIFDDQYAALAAGCEAFGSTAFLVKEIAHEEPAFLSVCSDQHAQQSHKHPPDRRAAA